MRPLVRLPLGALAEGEQLLDAAAAHYLTRVHRLGPGDPFVAFDPARALEADARVAALEGPRVRVRCEALRPAALRPVRALVVVQCVAKADKLDAVVRDATELGATRFVPALAERSQRRPAGGLCARLRRVAVEAARQCGRGDVPVVDEPRALAAVVEELAPRGDAALGLCLEPSAAERLAACARELGRATSVALLVGPEGGFTPGERAHARAQGYREVALGPLVLRAETVCAAALGGLAALGFAPFG
ncbi:MAG: 16S rRNA (uracil(1498)-N(3))-methyltransferase [Polyangiaceae bacterium]|nr:16S rRNA (uracil(1498)-N(3))-methyltransferase [Polyangiaceae bacterium]